VTQGERVNEVRKKSQLTMDQFGERLGVTKTAISYVVNGKRNLTEQMLKSICREFSVDEEWLRTGDGDMPQKKKRFLLWSAICWKTGEIIHFSELSLRLFRHIMSFLRPARKYSRKPVRS